MRLKRLSIKGFKSFADQTDIHFNENLIGIVGPNGSGKSNIVDAIRWVLGEQKTSELRLDSMSDVLFNGTKERKEGKVAKVTLSFDNTKHILPTEFNEVSISRVLYRNGSSEYLLNNVPCRKKDITNLFIDSGIGSNSYAIISLNMVEDILHDNGGSRRHMIEQAAGISKYKIRKKETLSKLRSTTEDLDRVQDLLYEIEKNMASFERQARRTERFNKLKEEYKELSIKISHIEVKELNQTYRELTQLLKNEKDARIHLNTQLTADEALLQQLKVAILESEKSLSHDQQQFNELIEKLGQVENKKNLSLQRLQNAKDRVIEINANAEQLKIAVDNAHQKLADAKEQEEAIQHSLTAEESNYEKANQDFVVKSNTYNDLRKREKEIKTAQTENQLLKETLLREIESLSTRKRILESDLQQLSERLEILKENSKGDLDILAKREAVINEMTNSIEIAQNRTTELEEEIQKSNEALASSRTEYNKKQVALSSLEQRIKFLKNIIENNEGLPEAAKFILKNKGNNHPVFSDLVEIVDERYTKITELYLGPYLHHLISDTKKEAIKIYEQVRDAQKGKINVLVLDEIEDVKGEKSTPNLLPITSVIRVEKRYQKVLNMICANVFIAQKSYKEIDHTQFNKKAVVLFPDEYLVITDGHVFGGSNTLFEGVQLGRKKMLEKLEKQSSTALLELEKANAQLDSGRKVIEEKQAALKNQREILSELRLKFDGEKSKLFEIQSKIKNQTENQEEFESQVTAKNIELKGIGGMLIEKNRKYEEIESQKLDELSDQELTIKIEEAFKNYNRAGVLRDEAQAKLFDVRSQHNLALKDVEFYQNNIHSIGDRLNSFVLEEKQQTTIVEETSEALKSQKEELEKLYSLKVSLQEKLSSYEDTYYKEKGRIFELEKAISEQRSKLSAKDHLINSLTEKHANLGFEIKGIHERNSIEFGIEIKEVEFPEEYEDEDLSELKISKTKIQDRIRSYGEINPMAITAYNEIKGRHEQISKERDDILDAKSSLEETIAEIEKSASERFIASLNDIRKNFKEVFQALFSSDDDCDIVLLNSDDPLEAKIEIVAKPKGKRPKSINLLSGGEKTLTAASFLFALYLLKPAPFCIFDEVDAPLDDVNVLKFNKIIRNFSGDSQFIIITHNKLTMSEVDILYGVYLKELGVSGVSAVDFRTYDQTEMAMAN